MDYFDRYVLPSLLLVMAMVVIFAVIAAAAGGFTNLSTCHNGGGIEVRLRHGGSACIKREVIIEKEKKSG